MLTLVLARPGRGRHGQHLGHILDDRSLRRALEFSLSGVFVTALDEHLLTPLRKDLLLLASDVDADGTDDEGDPEDETTIRQRDGRGLGGVAP